MRLFVAVEIAGTVGAALEAEVCGPLSETLPGARFTRPEGRHLTLKFLGETEDGRLGAVEAALGRAVDGHGPVELALGELGGFPNLRRPRVVWVGVAGATESLARLAGDVEAELAAVGFPREQRAFRPHLTLCRFRVPEQIGDLPVVDVPDEGFVVSEVVLFRSQLHPEGARYSALARFPLGG